jgi:NAD-dependent SIR2 family protein deacetylase
MLSNNLGILEAIESGKSPWDLLAALLNRSVAELQAHHNLRESDIWRFLLFSERRMRVKEHIDDVNKAIELIDKAQNVVVILGAGGSVGLDFRSSGGLYDSIAKDGVFDDPCNVFDLEYFERDPSIFWKYAYTIFPAREPEHSATHFFLKKIEEKGKLLRVYTQNVDTLEVGIPDEKLCCVHGSWRSCVCRNCGYRVPIEELRPSIESRVMPVCKICGGPIKPGIVFFGQPTNLDDREAYSDARVADLLIVIGTSLRVAPISELPDLMSNVPSILINRSPVTCDFNMQLLGECSEIVQMLERELGWRDDEGVRAKDSIFFPPNSFVFEADNELATRIVDTARNKFLATSVVIDVRDLE